MAGGANPVYRRGESMMERVLPAGPQAASVVRLMDEAGVSQSLGAVEVDVPFYTLEGKELCVPIGVRYMSHGIRLDEIAGVAGLGWSLYAGGCVTRSVMDMPDEFTSQYMTHRLPSGSLLSSLEGDVNNTATHSYLEQVCFHRIDTQLDLYEYNVCGLSGSFVIDGDEVIQLSGDGVLIGFTRADDGGVGSFTIAAPDGVRYTLSEREVGTHNGSGGIDVGYDPTKGEKDIWSATTAWYLTEMTSAGGLERAAFAYKDGQQWDRSIVSRYQSETHITGPVDQPSLASGSSTIVTHYTTKLLTDITLDGFAVHFTYAEGKTRTLHTDITEWNFPARFTGVRVTAPQGETLKSITLDTGRDQYDGRVILKSITFKGSDAEVSDIYRFSYNTKTSKVSHLQQDWFGYYNGETNASGNGVCPFTYSPKTGGSTSTCGEPRSRMAGYMSLREMDHDGAKTSFEYGYYRLSGQKERIAGSPVVKITTSSAPIDGDPSTVKTYTRSFTYADRKSDGPEEPTQDMYTTTRPPYTLSDMTSSGTSGEQTITWSFTLHESPVVNGPSIRSTRTWYGTVTEETIGSDGVTKSKSVRKFDTSDVRRGMTDVSGRFPSGVKTLYRRYPPYGTERDPLVGIQQQYTQAGPALTPLPIRDEEYAYDTKTQEYRLVSAVNYTYDKSFGAERKVLFSYEARQVWYPVGYGNCPYGDIFHYPVYAQVRRDRPLVGKSLVEYFADEDTQQTLSALSARPAQRDSVHIKTAYFHRDSLLTSPLQVKSVSVKERATTTLSMGRGNVLRRSTYAYPQKGSVLYARHMVSAPVSTTYSITPDYIERVTGPVTGPGSLKKADADGADGESSGERESESESEDEEDDCADASASTNTLIGFNASIEKYREETEYGYFIIEGKQVYLPKSRIEYVNGREKYRESITARDCKGNIAEIRRTGHPVMVLIWSYEGRYPVAVIEGATLDEVTSELRGLTSIRSITLSKTFTSALQQILDETLRACLPGTHMSVYTHKEGVGVSSISDVAGVKLSYTYDPSGRLTEVKDAEGHLLQGYEYHTFNGSDGNGLRRITGRTYRNASGTLFTEDTQWWNTLGVEVQSVERGAAGDGRDLVTVHEADALGRDDARVWLPIAVNTGGAYQSDALTLASTQHTDKGYRATHRENSERGRVYATALPLFDGAHENRFTEGCAEEFPSLDYAGGNINDKGIRPAYTLRRLSSTDADGRVRHTYRDHFGKVHGSAQGEDAPSLYVYDAQDRLRAVAGSGIELSDTLSMWRYDYDSLDRVRSKGIPGSVREFYTYDEGDRVLSAKQDGTLIEYEYDEFGRLIRVYFSDEQSGARRTLVEEHVYDRYPGTAFPSGAGVSERMESTLRAWSGSPVMGYEAAVRLAEFSGESGRVNGYATVVYRYDSKGHIVERISEYPDEGVLGELFEYDLSGARTRSEVWMEESGQRVCTYVRSEEYDNRGHIKSALSSLDAGNADDHTEISSTFTYDTMGRLSGGSVAAGESAQPVVKRITYTPQGWKNRVWYIQRSKTFYDESLGYNDFQSALCLSYEGYITRKTESCDGKNYTNIHYAYDYAGRLIKEKTGSKGSEVGYSYDARCNLLSVSIGGRLAEEYFYTADRLTGLDLGAGAHPFSYDSRGRTLGDYTPSGGRRLTYNNYLNRVSATSSVNFSYLADGEKTCSLTKEGEVGLVYRGPFVFRQDGRGERTLEGVECPEGKLTAEKPYIYIKDHLGSVVSVVNGMTGEVVENSEYDAYGRRTQLQSSRDEAESRLLREHFTGKEDQMSEFGIDYTDFGARLYSPTIRRWLTPDPLSEKYYGISPYAYCAGNPVNFVDPDGRDWYSHEKITRYKNGYVERETIYSWTDAKSKNEFEKLNIKGEYLGPIVVVFNGYYDERLGKGQNLAGEGAKAAQVKLYGNNSENDIHEYIGYTMSSDPTRFGVIANGNYLVNHVDPNPESKIPKEWAINYGKDVPGLNGYNPAHPEREDGHLEGTFVHRTNLNGYAGYDSKTGQAVSEGCLLILASQWEDFQKQLGDSKSFMLILNRR